MAYRSREQLSSVQLGELRSRCRRLGARVESLEAENRLLKRRRSLTDPLHGLERHQTGILDGYIEALTQLHSMSAAISASPIGAGGARGGHYDPPSFNPVPVWAANRLSHELEDLSSACSVLTGWLQHPTPTRALRSARRHRCAACGLRLSPIEMVTSRASITLAYCPRCGQDLGKKSPRKLHIGG